MSVAGIDFSSRAVDVVLLEEDSDRAEWHRFEFEGANAFDRARQARPVLPGLMSEFWDEVLAIGIEDPRGYNAGALYRVQGAILSCLPFGLLVQPWIPSAWRKAVGLPGNASKADVAHFALNSGVIFDWPQDACDAYCIALATRQALHQDAAA